MEGKDLLSMSSHFPPGFRFHPTDEELISCYLSKKITSSLPQDWDIVADIDIYKFNPWDLPGKALVFGDREWFFFSPRERKYPRGLRPNRSAGSGYWKATGTDKPILGAGGTQCIGVKKALVFYKGRPPKGTKTDWVMHEYRVMDSNFGSYSQLQKLNGSMRLDDWVLCRVRKKGNLPVTASVNTTETCSPAESSPAISRQSEENVAAMESSCFTADQFWNDDQLLDYNFLNFDDPVCSMRHSDPGGGGGDYLEIPSTAFGSLKRKLSVDVSMLPEPGKRFQCSPDGLLSTGSSVSVNQFFPDFFL